MKDPMNNVLLFVIVGKVARNLIENGLTMIYDEKYHGKEQYGVVLIVSGIIVGKLTYDAIASND